MSQYSKAINDYPADIKEYIGKTIKYIKKNSYVLDVGCSSGYFGKLLIDYKTAKVDGIEIDPSDVKKAVKVLNKVYSFDLDDKDWPKELMAAKYDIIFFGDVLEHLKDPQDVLMKFMKLLNKTGKIIISIPNIAHVSVRLELLAGNFDYEKLGILDETHLKYFTYSSFTRLLRESGYKVIDYDYDIAVQPKDTIESWLENIGLKGSDKFYNLMNAPDAVAYQYKIVAEPGKDKQKSVLPTKPLKLAYDHGLSVKELQSEINGLNVKIQDREEAIKQIEESLSWKITKPLRSAKSSMKKKK